MMAARAFLWAWPIPATIAVALVAQRILVDSRYDLGGHAAEPLTSASAFPC